MRFDMVSLGQLLGWFLSVVGFFVFIAKTRRSILISKLICDIGFCTQQLMVGAPTGALIQAIAVFRELVFYHREHKKWAAHRFWLYFFVVLMMLSPLFTWAGPVSLLPAVGSALAVYAFYCINPHYTRIYGLLSSVLWFFYSFLMGNYPMAFTSAVQILSAILGLLRDHHEARGAKQEN